MAVTTLKLAGREFVILPKSEYATLKARAKTPASQNGKRASRRRRPTREDLADLAEIARIKRDPSEKPIPWAEVRKHLA